MMSLQDRNAQFSPDEEKALFERVVDRDKEALANLYCAYHPRLFRFTYRLTHSYGAAEELVNDVMMAVWDGAAKFRGGSKVSTWVFGIAYRKCMSHLRKKRVATDSEVSVEHLADTAPDAADDREWIREGLEQLPEEQRLCMILVFYVGCSYAEVAAITDCKAETVKTRMFHARRKLRTSMPDLAEPNIEGET